MVVIKGIEKTGTHRLSTCLTRSNQGFLLIHISQYVAYDPIPHQRPSFPSSRALDA
jgi:hypothetical protein